MAATKLSTSWEVPKGTVVLRGVHDETYIAVAAYLRSLAYK